MKLLQSPVVSNVMLLLIRSRQEAIEGVDVERGSYASVGHVTVVVDEVVDVYHLSLTLTLSSWVSLLFSEDFLTNRCQK